MKTIRYGSQGPDVMEAQKRLNALKSTQPSLAEDGIFGSKTLARVKEFQRTAGLVVDGIVGPNTWAKLPEAKAAKPKPREGEVCGNGDEVNQLHANAIKVALVQSLGGSDSVNAIARLGARRTRLPGFGAGVLSVLPSFSKLTGPQVTTAKSVFGTSIDFSRVFISDKAGLQNRAFVVAIHIDIASSIVTGISPGWIQVMNCGTFSPSKSRLIHELTHVWQSQHHNDKRKFMSNAVGSQGEAIARNAAEGIADTDSPFSAYAYIPGSAFGEYGAEQNAKRVELGESTAISHVKSVAAHAHDSANETSLATFRTQDRRASGVKG